MRTPRHHLDPRQRGVTLIEIMVAMVVSSIVALGIFAFSSIQHATNTLHSRNVRVQQALDGAMWSMEQDLRVAGLGFARLCTELRIWGETEDQLVNPGAYKDPDKDDTVYFDPTTGSAFWSLRDGLQAHWNSSVAGASMNACANQGSNNVACPTDSFDVILAERNYTNMFGVFTITPGEDPTAANLDVTADGLDGAPIAEVRQLMPPGSFVVIAPEASTGENAANNFTPLTQSQCSLLQVTGDVTAGSATNRWLIPISTTGSQFNANKVDLLTPTSSADADIVKGGENDVMDVTDNWQVIPVGRLRWSRYAIDYSVPRFPYLVRYDLIGFKDGVDPDNLGVVDYPHCEAGDCRAPGLHLPTDDDDADAPLAVAIGPMIEDMQVAVGCDGWGGAVDDMPAPDGFDDVGAASGTNAGLANLTIDEHDDEATENRENDEWLGNAINEQTAPDCVFYGTGEELKAGWEIREGTQQPPPAHRMSPQTIRITLIGASEHLAATRGDTDQQATVLKMMEYLVPVEDRAELQSVTGQHDRFTLTRRFTPKNLRWRDPGVL